jgi:hypothetical protein
LIDPTTTAARSPLGAWITVAPFEEQAGVHTEPVADHAPSIVTECPRFSDSVYVPVAT